MLNFLPVDSIDLRIFFCVTLLFLFAVQIIILLHTKSYSHQSLSLAVLFFVAFLKTAFGEDILFIAFGEDISNKSNETLNVFFSGSDFGIRSTIWCSFSDIFPIIVLFIGRCIYDIHIRTTKMSPSDCDMYSLLTKLFSQTLIVCYRIVYFGIID